MATQSPVEPEPEPAGANGDGRPVHDILVAVPFPHRLSTKLLGMTAVVALAALAGLVLAERRIERDLVDQVQRSTALLGEAVQTSAHEEMLHAEPRHVYGVLESVARLDGVERVRVLDKTGRVTFSTVPSDAGQVVRQDGACRACHSRAQPLSRAPAALRSEILRGAHGRVLTMIAPFYNDRGCATAACHVHPQGRQVLGLLEIRVSLEHLDAEVISFRFGFVALLAAAVVLLAALLYLFGRSEIVEPVAALLEGTRRVARNELDVEIRVHSHGELGLLARSFNVMTGALRRLEDELEGLLGGLEKQVEARTADLQAAQAQLVRSEKLSSLGKLSASIAHEINNPLAGILTFAKLVSRTLAEGTPDDTRRASLQRNLALVEREAQRCSAIVKSLLDFARERPIAPKPVDPRAVVEEALSLVGNQLHTQGIALELELAETPLVLADFGQLRQAFVNIAMNGCEAMGSAGRLRVSTREHDGGVEIAFADTGPGIPPELLKSIFDPFFTTKERGTGLGLSVVYGIVERHGGGIDVKSDVGKGTVFTIRLPACASPAAESAAAETAAS